MHKKDNANKEKSTKEMTTKEWVAKNFEQEKGKDKVNNSDKKGLIMELLLILLRIKKMVQVMNIFLCKTYNHWRTRALEK